MKGMRWKGIFGRGISVSKVRKVRKIALAGWGLGAGNKKMAALWV